MHKRTLQKTNPPFLKKIGLIIFGLFLFFVLLEITLRISGFILLSVQESRNLKAIKQKGTFRIMCLGESTTQGEWPHVLQEILNQQKIGIKFSVIDKGIGGTNTSSILQCLETNIKKYQPHMVITMMGINDSGAHMPIKYTLESPGNHFLMQLKTYKLIRLIMLRFKTKLKNSLYLRENEFDKNNLPEGSNDESAFINLGSSYLSRGLYKEAEKAFWKAIKFNPKNPAPYGMLRACYRESGNYEEGIESMEKNIESNPDNYMAYVELALYYHNLKRYSKNDFDFSESERLLKKAIDINPKYELAYIDLSQLYLFKGELVNAEETIRRILEFNARSEGAYLGLAYLYRDYYSDKCAQAEEMFKKAIEINPTSLITYLELGRCYMKCEKKDEAEQMYKKALEIDPNSVIAHRALAILYKEKGESDLADQHSAKTEALCKSYCPRQTAYNYRKLRDILVSKGIQLICVQYPMRSIIPLQKLFGENREGVIFVDNENCFKNTVKQSSYAEYFKDNFAGDFGHCTLKGNRLLAANIAKTVLKEYFKR